METLNLEKKTALKIFKAASTKDVQNILMDTFGNEIFLTKITDRITSFDDAFDLADEQTRLECQVFKTDTPDVVAYKKLKLIIKVINEDFIPDFTNSDQPKYYPWFRVGSSGSGFGFSGTHFIYDSTNTTVGSRLCFVNAEKCEYVAKQFIQLYEQFLLTK